jgi:hypothetical protein
MGYRHTQVGLVTLVLLVAAAVVITVLSAVLGWNPVGIAVLCIVAVVATLFSSLTVAVGEGTVAIRFGSGLIHKRWPLADIRCVSVVRNPWYYGWGIHWTPHGWLYNVSGLGAVEVVFASGKKARIGSDEPEKLAEAIRQSIATSKP